MRNNIILVSFLMWIFLLLPLVHAISLSLGPTNIYLVNVTRGQEYDRLLRIGNGDTKPTFVSINVTGNASEWVSVYLQDNMQEKINSLTIPANSTLNLIARFSIPEDTPAGEYGAVLSFQQSIEQSGINISGFGLRASSNVKIYVTGEQTLTGNVLGVSAPDTELARPLRITVQFQNTGNVLAKPNIKATISKGGSQVAQIDYSEATVRVGSTSTIPVNWDTSGYATGEYQANVKVLLAGRLLSEETLNFKILERGVLTAAGTIVGQSFPGEVVSGKPGKLEAQFRNTGDIQVDARIKAEIYLNDELVDVVEGDPVTVDVGQTQTLTAYYTPEVEGEYSIKFFVSYEGKSTETKTLSFASSSPQEAAEQQQEQQAENTGAPQNNNNNDNNQNSGEAANTGSPITGGALDTLNVDTSFLAPVAVIVVVIIVGALAIITMVRRNRAPRGYSFGG